MFNSGVFAAERADNHMVARCFFPAWVIHGKNCIPLDCEGRSVEWLIWCSQLQKTLLVLAGGISCWNVCWSSREDALVSALVTRRLRNSK